MRVTRIAVTTTLLVSSMAVVAQGPVKDTLVVTFPNPVIVAGKSLPPGEYTVRQLESTTSPRILEFSTEDGTKVQASASAIPMETTAPKEATGVILEQRGNNYYVSKIWVEGQRYGYQFEPPNQEEVLRVVRVEGMRMAVTYKPGEAPKEVAQAQQQPEPRTQPTPQSTTPPVQEPEPTPQPVTPPVREPEPTPQPATSPVQEPAPAPTPVRDPIPESEPVRTTPAMPDTAAHWLPLLLAGGGMVLTGWRLRRANQQ